MGAGVQLADRGSNNNLAHANRRGAIASIPPPPPAPPAPPASDSRYSRGNLISTPFNDLNQSMSSKTKSDKVAVGPPPSPPLRARPPVARAVAAEQLQTDSFRSPLSGLENLQG